ncbi:hypothetical protein IP90_01012 [Luteimonas cucumeris]|uniref:Copper(I)-binding protein n=1 Tax=Luteimonas cucumeris TaxID=985012 RepID=A0A562LB59_9GAMM|nr:copper chaperone PCu(A)C [Luteimonas cucumeris]TWI04871.1 hypothetical protein IP90_01012 [Luteimonas cucumeris]
MSKTAHALFVLLAALCGPVAARDCAPQVRDAWIRLVPGGMPMHAGFGRIENRCPDPVSVVSASSPAYGSVELHETRVVDGVSRMRAVPELRIAADGTATLQPGGLHLMLMQPHAALKAGDKVTLAFTLADGRKLPAEFEVRNPAAP